MGVGGGCFFRFGFPFYGAASFGLETLFILTHCSSGMPLPPVTSGLVTNSSVTPNSISTSGTRKTRWEIKCLHNDNSVFYFVIQIVFFRVCLVLLGIYFFPNCKILLPVFYNYRTKASFTLLFLSTVSRWCLFWWTTKLKLLLMMKWVIFSEMR